MIITLMHISAMQGERSFSCERFPTPLLVTGEGSFPRVHLADVGLQFCIGCVIFFTVTTREPVRD